MRNEFLRFQPEGFSFDGWTHPGIIPFLDNEKTGNWQEEKPQIRSEIIENLESYEIANKNNLEVISQPSSENGKNKDKVEIELNENNEIIREDNKLQYTYPIPTTIFKKQSIPTFRGSTEK